MNSSNDKTIQNENNFQTNKTNPNVIYPYSNDQNYWFKNYYLPQYFNQIKPPLIYFYPMNTGKVLKNNNVNIFNINNNISSGQIKRLKKNKNFFNDKESENNETCANSKKSKKSQNENNIIINDNDSTLSVWDSSKDEPEAPLFEKINNKLNRNEYEQEELIKDMRLLIDKSVFIKQFNEYSFLNIESFSISKCNDSNIIHLKLNLINFINIINAISNYSKNNQSKFVSILNKLGIYFSWIKCDNNKNSIAVLLLTPKSSTLYNYISTHGSYGIGNEKYKNEMKNFLTKNEKYFYYGYCYKDFSVSNLIDLIGKDNYEIFPNVMYFIKKNAAEKLINSELVKLTGEYNIVEFPNFLKNNYSFCETDLIISMLKNTEIESNFNFRNIIKGDLNVVDNKIILEEKNYYLFEIKTKIGKILDDIQKIEIVQKKFIEALENVEVDKKNPHKGQKFQRILMCDNNYSEAKEGAKDEKLNNKALIYSGFQVEITHINRLNNNIKDLYKKIGDLEGKNTELIGNINSQNEKIKLQDEKIKLQDEKISNQKKEMIDLRNENNILKENINKIMANYDMLSTQLQSLINSKESATKITDEIVLKNDEKAKNGINGKINKTKFIEDKLKLLDSVLKDNSILISVILKSANSLSLIKETFEIFFKQFVLILQEIKNCENSLYLRIEPLLNNNKGNSNLSQIEKLLVEKIQKNDICSIYYKGVKNLLFGDDEKASLGNVLNTFDEKKKLYIQQLIGFIEIFENNQNIENIEMKMQGAILFIMLKLYDEKKLIFIFDEVTKNNENVRNIIKILISSLNSCDNYIHN